MTSQGEDEEKTLARELAHHYAAILGIMDRFRELQSVKGTAAPVRARRGESMAFYYDCMY